MTVHPERLSPRAGIRALASERPRREMRIAAKLPVLRSAKGAGVIVPRGEADQAMFYRLEADPRVSSWSRFDPAPFLTPDQACALSALVMVRIVHDTGNYVIVAHDTPIRGKLAHRGMASLEGQLAAGSVWLLPVQAEQLFSQPRCRNSKAVAACRFVQVSAGDRLRISEEVDRQGGLELSECAGLVSRRTRREDVVFSLVCDGTVGLDLDKPLTPHSLLVSRRVPASPRTRFLPGVPPV